jgi:hypothetical protein
MAAQLRVLGRHRRLRRQLSHLGGREEIGGAWLLSGAHRHGREDKNTGRKRSSVNRCHG